MSKLENALIYYNSVAIKQDSGVSATSYLIVTIVYLVALLSISIYRPEILIWFALYPVIQAEISGIGFLKVFKESLWILPIIILFGIFNPIFDTRTAFAYRSINISYGLISFVSLLLRGLLSFQAIIIMAKAGGIYDICNSLRKIGCPKTLTNQILFTYRYIGVLMEESINMDRARRARGFGNRHYPWKMWGMMIGQLLIRSYERGKRINNAMLARGFSGSMPSGGDQRSNRTSVIFVILWTMIIIFLRYYPIYKLFGNFNI